MDELHKFMVKVTQVEENRVLLFNDFDKEMPAFVLQQRDLRNKKTTHKRASSKNELAYMIGRIKDTEIVPMFTQLYLSCKYKRVIRQQLDNSRIVLWEELDAIIEKFRILRAGIKKFVKVVYKFVQGDEIDKLFGEALMRRGCTVMTKRTKPGMYMFGTRSIIAKIVNMKLIIKVGGGYMTIDEFITQYGPIEMLKWQQAQDRENGVKSKSRTSSPTKA